MYGTFSPGGDQLTIIDAWFSSLLAESIGHARTFVGASGSADASVKVVSFAFCARFEKLLLRLDM